mmetsp:Transcript_37549/g.62175  ORF Transcript_37549/g.62175 Transcript_37549/m.62175 type:complete len:111 (-) Transcript_37549:226-558(-)
MILQRQWGSTQTLSLGPSEIAKKTQEAPPNPPLPLRPVKVWMRHRMVSDNSTKAKALLPHLLMEGPLAARDLRFIHESPSQRQGGMERFTASSWLSLCLNGSVELIAEHL